MREDYTNWKMAPDSERCSMIVKDKLWVRPYDIAYTRSWWPIALTADPEPITNFIGQLIVGLLMNAVLDKYLDMITWTIENECYGPDTATAFGSSPDAGTYQFIWWIVEMVVYFPVFVFWVIASLFFVDFDNA